MLRKLIVDFIEPRRYSDLTDSSLSNTGENAYYAAEFAIVTARYEALQGDEVSLSNFVREQQETATQMIRVGYVS
jgi:hypothetical protein